MDQDLFQASADRPVNQFYAGWRMRGTGNGRESIDDRDVRSKHCDLLNCLMESASLVNCCEDAFVLGKKRSFSNRKQADDVGENDVR